MSRPCLNQVYEPAKYGSCPSIPFTNLTAQDQNIVPAANSLRTLLILRTPSTNTAPVNVNFGQGAGTSSLLELTAGSTYVFDNAVPQDDIYASGAGQTIIVGFMLRPKTAENV
jgi:hypothetical protein